MLDRNVACFWHLFQKTVKIPICALGLPQALVSLLLKALSAELHKPRGLQEDAGLPPHLEQRLHWADA